LLGEPVGSHLPRTFAPREVTGWGDFPTGAREQHDGLPLWREGSDFVDVRALGPADAGNIREAPARGWHNGRGPPCRRQTN